MSYIVVLCLGVIIGGGFMWLVYNPETMADLISRIKGKR